MSAGWVEVIKNNNMTRTGKIVFAFFIVQYLTLTHLICKNNVYRYNAIRYIGTLVYLILFKMHNKYIEIMDLFGGTIRTKRSWVIIWVLIKTT